MVLPDHFKDKYGDVRVPSQCTYRCVVLPDIAALVAGGDQLIVSQCTYRCVVLPDIALVASLVVQVGSQCTYRCVVLPDAASTMTGVELYGMSQCTYRCVVLPDRREEALNGLDLSLNAPTGAWCSLTPALGSGGMTPLRGPGAPPAPGAPLRTGQHRAQTST